MIEMIGDKDHLIMNKNGPMKIVEDEKSGKPETGIPERKGDKAIQIIIIRRWRVIGDHRRPLIVIIAVYLRGYRIIGNPPIPGIDADFPQFCLGHDFIFGSPQT